MDPRLDATRSRIHGPWLFRLRHRPSGGPHDLGPPPKALGGVPLGLAASQDETKAGAEGYIMEMIRWLLGIAGMCYHMKYLRRCACIRRRASLTRPQGIRSSWP